ncbi:MAG: efflux RND transporter periplasmic adaptor subunit [Cyanothece sp. SIO1E1]|nr:efflux RND transporter periplasmic adaptor subunit [Cyanothece sp. SIO1E1]
MASSESRISILHRFAQWSSKLHLTQTVWFWLLITFLLLTGGGLAWQLFSRSRSLPETAVVEAVPVKVSSVEVGTVKTTSEFVGALEAEQRVVLKPEVAGQITQIAVVAGEQVTKGQSIVQLSPDRSEAQMNGAIANVKAVRAARNSEQADLLASQAEVDMAAAEVALQHEEFRRSQALLAEGAISQQELDRDRRNRDAAIAALNAAKRRVQANQAALEEAKAALVQAQANVAVASENLADFRIAAPIEGVVGDFLVKVGDYVDVGETLTNVIQNQTLELRLAVPLERTAGLQVGLPVELRLAKTDAPLVVGQISFISPQVDADAQAVLAKASFPNPNGVLKDEQFVRARVIWREQPGVLVPTTAVSYLGNQAFVFVVETTPDVETASPQQIARQKPIKLGELQGNYYQVLAGLQPEATIVTSGILNLSDGALIVPEAEPAAAAVLP